jgi:hypothetical protein
MRFTLGPDEFLLNAAWPRRDKNRARTLPYVRCLERCENDPEMKQRMDKARALKDAMASREHSPAVTLVRCHSRNRRLQLEL